MYRKCHQRVRKCVHFYLWPWFRFKHPHWIYRFNLQQRWQCNWWKERGVECISSYMWRLVVFSRNRYLWTSLFWSVPWEPSRPFHLFIDLQWPWYTFIEDTKKFKNVTSCRNGVDKNSMKYYEISVFISTSEPFGRLGFTWKLTLTGVWWISHLHVFLTYPLTISTFT